MAKSTLNGSKTERVRYMFNHIAKRYDLLNKLMSFGIDHQWRNCAAQWVAKHQPRLLLDVAVGTADLSLAMVQKCPTLEQIVGVDISEGMLQKGREKLAHLAPRVPITLEWANCEELPYAEATFDAVVSGFGVRNFEHLTRGLQEMYRVTRSGGIIAILELSIPRSPHIRIGYKFWTHSFVPFVGRLVSHSKDAYTYLPHSITRVPQYEQFCQILQEVGYQKTSYRPLSGGIATLYVGVK